MARSKNVKIAVLSLLLVALLILGIYTFSNLDIFYIKDVEVEAKEIGCASEKALRDESKVEGANFFLIRDEKVKEKLKEKFYCINSIKLTKIFPGKIKVEVGGREPAAVLLATPSAEATASAKHLIVDGEGVLFLTGDRPNLPRIYIAGLNLNLGQRLNGALIENALKVLGYLKSLSLEVKEAKIDEAKLLSIDGMFKIYFSLEKDIDIQLASLQLILNQAKIDDSKIETVDFRFDKPVVRYAKR